MRAHVLTEIERTDHDLILDIHDFAMLNAIIPAEKINYLLISENGFYVSFNLQVQVSDGNVLPC